MDDKKIKRTYTIFSILLIIICITPSIKSNLNNTYNILNNKNSNIYTHLNSALLAYWSLDEGSGNIANDYSGHNISGLINGATWTNGYSSYALNFDGNNDYINLDGHARELGLNKTDDYKISAWFKTESNHPGIIFMVSDESDPIPIFYIKIKSDGTIEMKVQSTSSCVIQINSEDSYNNGLWHFIEGIYHGSEGYPDLELYIDNEFVTSGSDWLCPMYNNQFNRAKIGMASYDTLDNFVGVIDEIKIYKRSIENQPPNPPEISGPIAGTIGEVYNYSFFISDPEGDELYLLVNWGDNLTTGWIGLFNSNENIVLNHSWSENGPFEINAKLRDTFDIGELGTLIVVMGNIAPTKPTIKGPKIGNKSEQLEYIFNSSDLNGDNISYYIEWGDGKTEWTEFIGSGREVRLQHNWSKFGIYNIIVKTRDINNAESNWSTPFTVTITEKALIFGFLENKSFNEDLIEFNARILLFISLEPYQREIYSSGEKIKISYQYVGNLGDKFIFGIFNAVIL